MEDTPISSRQSLGKMVENHRLWLTGDNSKGAQFYMEDSVLTKADLSGYDLTDAVLVGSSFRQCVMTETDFYYSFLASSRFTEVRMRGVILAKANLDYTSFKNCDISCSNTIKAAFYQSVADEVDFSNSEMMKASFVSSTLSRTKFINCQLTRASFKNSRLQDVDFSGADLSDADFSNAQLSRVTFSGAYFNEKTIWPERFNPTQAGAIRLEAGEYDDHPTT